MSLDSLLLSAVGNSTNNSDGKNDDGSAAADDLKFVFVGGKGGVGKTTSSSAIATLFARHCKKRVLLISTDPAHSLGDAFRCNKKFSNTPVSPNPDTLPNLHVMEVDPSETMKVELQKWATLAEEVADDDSIIQKMHQFQEWLSGIPGIDEATALSSAIHHIESGDYDLIVFDTAPTGHTLKLLAMPEILQAGIEKLQSWQGTLWGVYESFKSAFRRPDSKKRKRNVDTKAEVAQKLEDYKHNIQKVAWMLQDQARTRFVVVCIAELLSISETQRLLQELKKNRVRASHIIVNQLVTHDALSQKELQDLEALAEVGGLDMNQALLQKTVHACRLTTSRKNIQEKYLRELKSFPETQNIIQGICEIPLLAEEVTGWEALERFANLLITTKELPVPATTPGDNKKPVVLYENNVVTNSTPAATADLDTSTEQHTWTPRIGDRVMIHGLVKSEKYNGFEGIITKNLNEETGRYGVQIEDPSQQEQPQKVLALQLKNIKFEKQRKTEGAFMNNSNDDKIKKQKISTNSTASLVPESNRMEHGGGGGMMDKAKKVLEDPEIKSMIDKNPKVAAAVKDVLQNPMSFLQYMADPELSPFISKAMSKL